MVKSEHHQEVCADHAHDVIPVPLRHCCPKRELDLIASLSAFYRKLARMEPAVSAAIVLLLPTPIARVTASAADRAARQRYMVDGNDFMTPNRLS